MNSVQNCTLYSNAGGMMTMKRSNSSPSNSLESPTSTTTSTNDFMIFHPPPPPNSSSSDHHHHHNNNHLIDFQASPLLTFDHHRNYSSSSWDNYDHSGSWHDEDALTTTAAPPPRDATHVTTDHWLYPDPSPTPTTTTTTTTTTNATVTTTTRDSYKHNHKRPNSGESGQQHPQKKQPSTSKSTAKPAKPSSSPPSKDPQSIAAKNRRERISERLKVLQELVPNGSKVDLVTMLEKAISYVKFLQLQVKVLATDEFWPAQGGKAPDIAQVKEAIDAILSSSRSGSCRNNNKNSSNSSNSTFEGLGEEEEEEE